MSNPEFLLPGFDTDAPIGRIFRAVANRPEREYPIQCRVRIEGTYHGHSWVYEDPEGSPGSQFIHLEDDGTLDPSTHWWQDGNYGCDCNRSRFLPDDIDDKKEWRCGKEILIDRVLPFDSSLPTLELNETTQGKSA